MSGPLRVRDVITALQQITNGFEANVHKHHYSRFKLCVSNVGFVWVKTEQLVGLLSPLPQGSCFTPAANSTPQV